MKKSLLSVKTWMPITIALFSISCAKGFNGSSTSTSSSSQSSQSNGTDSNSQQNTQLSTVDFTGYQAQGDKVGRLMVQLDKANEAVILILPLPGQILSLLGGLATTQIPNLPGAKLVVMPDKSIGISIPLKYIVRNASFKDPQFQNTLPNGDTLPAFPAGEGAQFALQITGKYIVHVYVGVKAAAVFIETPDWDSALDCGSLPICPSLGPWEIRSQNKQQILGYLAFVLKKGAFHSGAYVTTQFPDDLARFIDDHIKM